MTKEEIRHKHNIYVIYDKPYDSMDIENAMEEYADQEVSKFIATQNSFTETYHIPEHILQPLLDQEKEKEAIAFLDSIREYLHESHCNLWLDERTSEEFYQLYQSNNKTDSKMSITIIPQEKKYTQEDLDNARKEGFEAAREIRDKGYHPDFEVSGLKKYPTYESYLEKINT